MLGQRLVSYARVAACCTWLFGCGGEKPTYLDLEENPGDFPKVGDTPFAPVTHEYTRFRATAENAQHIDSDRFRIYYGGNELYGGQNNLSEENETDIRLALAQLESAYEYFVHDRGFRSPSLSVNSNDGPFYKLNIYAIEHHSSSGYMDYDTRSGLGFIEIRQRAHDFSRLIKDRSYLVHEFGHAITYSEYAWVGQSGADCWWEGVAEWADAMYAASAAHQQLALEHGLDPYANRSGFETTVAESHLSIAHQNNCYEMWPFLIYLERNPDGFPGLGDSIVLDLIRNHRRNNETPLHVLERLIRPVTVQQVLGRYWARMAYADIDYPLAQDRFSFASQDVMYRELAFSNWDYLGGGRFRVKEEKKPMYGGANVVPLVATSRSISVELKNLGNGLEDSNFTATISVRDVITGQTRYIELPGGTGSAELSDNETAAIVVVNTPDTLYQYSAYRSAPGSQEKLGLNYEIWLDGAHPRDTISSGQPTPQ